MGEKPGLGSKLATHMTTRFNEADQAELLFTENKRVLRLIDETIRYSVAGEISFCKAENIFEELHSRWVSIFGAPEVIITDQEGAFKSEIGVTFCQRHGIELKFTAKLVLNLNYLTSIQI